MWGGRCHPHWPNKSPCVTGGQSTGTLQDPVLFWEPELYRKTLDSSGQDPVLGYRNLGSRNFTKFWYSPGTGTWSSSGSPKSTGSRFSSGSPTGTGTWLSSGSPPGTGTWFSSGCPLLVLHWALATLLFSGTGVCDWLLRGWHLRTTWVQHVELPVAQ